MATLTDAQEGPPFNETSNLKTRDAKGKENLCYLLLNKVRTNIIFETKMTNLMLVQYF
jgi:hypothetical protein